MNRSIQFIFFVGLAALIGSFMQSCANIGSISGGEKDSIPPVMIASQPVFLDTNFKDNKVIIGFDEYFDLKNANQEFLASPPFQKAPDFKIKKKFLIVKFPEDLKDSVTYVLNFGNAIADHNEANVIKNFRFIFSTYSKIDSFSVSGNIQNAFDLTVPENTLVMLFEDHTDSIPFKSLASYISKIDSSGNFSIQHMKPGAYKIFAISDLNTNLKADDFEARAFLDSLIVPERIPFIKTDSLAAGTIIHDIHDKNIQDSLIRDTVITTASYKNKPADLKLYLFKEDNLDQQILDFARPSRSKLEINLQLPVGEEFVFTPLNASIANENLVLEKSIGRDSLIYWINDSLAIKTDTLVVQLTFLKKDSSGTFALVNDTLSFGFKEKKADDQRKRKPDQQKKELKEYLILNYLAKENKIDLNSKLYFESPTPIVEIDTQKITLFEIKDTLVTDPKEQKLDKAFRLQKDLLYFKFRRPVADRFWLQSLNFNSENWYTRSNSDSNRVFICRITDPAIAGMDTLKLKVHFDNHFFLEQIQELTDTAIMPLTVQKITGRKRSEAGKIELALYKSQNTPIEIIPEDYTARGNWYTIQKNRSADSISIQITDKKITDRDTLTFTLRCFDYINLTNDSIFFNETMRLIYKEKQQYLVSINRPAKEELKLVFNKQLSLLPEISPLNFTLNTKWSIVTRNLEGDSLNIKISDPFVADMDTLLFLVNYQDTNRKGKITSLKDTARFITRQRKDIRAKTTEDKIISEKPKSQNVSVPLPITFNIENDSASIRRKLILSAWKSNTRYLLTYDSLAFTDLFARYNKEGQYEFATRDLDYYAKLLLSLKQINPFDSIPLEPDSTALEKPQEDKTNIPAEELRKFYGGGNVILQLTGNKGVVIREYFLSEDQEVKMDFLPPGKYGLKIIFDRNNNGKWDTGNYFKNIQPERVIMSEKLIDLKSNFETKIDWNVSESFMKSFTTEK